MIFIQTNDDQSISLIHYMPFDEKYGLHKTEKELLEIGYLVNTVPEKYEGVIPDGKMPILKYNGSEFFWEMVDEIKRPKSLQDLENEITNLQSQQTATNDAVLGLMSMMTMMN